MSDAIALRAYQAVNAVRPTNIGMRTAPIGLLSDFTSSGAYTWQTTIALAQDADAFQIGFINGNNGSTTGSPALSGTITAVSDTTTSPAVVNGSLNLLFGGSTTGALTAAAGTTPTTTKRRKVTWSDWINLSTVARTDGGTLPLVIVRALVTVGVGAPITIPGGSSAPFSATTGWATHADGRIWDMKFKSGSLLGSSFSGYATGASVASQSPIAVIRYRARGRVITVMAVGDSIQEGYGSTIFGEGFIYPAVAALSNKDGLAIEYANLAWSSSDYNEIQSSVIDLIANGMVPDIVVLPSGTPNGAAPTIVSNTINAERQMLQNNLGLLTAAGAKPIVLTWTPANFAAKAWGATDSLRLTYNDRVKQYAASGVAIVDAAAPLSGAVDVNSQTTFAVGTSGDGLHPNDTGNALVIPKVRAAISSLLPLPARVF